VADGDLPVRAVDQDRLRVLEAALAGRRVPHVTDRARPGEIADRRFIEIVGDVAHRFVDAQSRAVGRRDADALLPAVLQRVQAEVGEIGGLRMAVNAEDAAFFFELVHFFKLAWGPTPTRLSRCARSQARSLAVLSA